MDRRVQLSREGDFKGGHPRRRGACSRKQLARTCTDRGPLTVAASDTATLYKHRDERTRVIVEAAQMAREQVPCISKPSVALSEKELRFLEGFGAGRKGHCGKPLQSGRAGVRRAGPSVAAAIGQVPGGRRGRTVPSYGPVDASNGRPGARQREEGGGQDRHDVVAGGKATVATSRTNGDIPPSPLRPAPREDLTSSRTPPPTDTTPPPDLFCIPPASYFSRQTGRTSGGARVTCLP
ncbi:hypothetical protein HPB51_009201 [Rhipicephalus microplus]|uniref:Uncharacterized protein n=1 Tax=Rhipicephalus microplus TaxID=6941 RepID=A0A9J6F0E3_RHIMP|nr:hypothetical protein HPB51_009201 [Rhipicephalus microplus]